MPADRYAVAPEIHTHYFAARLGAAVLRASMIAQAAWSLLDDVALAEGILFASRA